MTHRICFALAVTAVLTLTLSAAALADRLIIDYRDGSRQSIPLNRNSGSIKALHFEGRGNGGQAGHVTPTRPNTNLALGKHASQSSTGYNGQPGRAVDGNLDGHYFHGNSVTHTNKERGAWWQVDLGHVHRIKSIRIMNRTDCCGERLSNFYVLVSDHPFTSKDLNTTLHQRGVWSSRYPSIAGRQTDIPVHKNGRYVRIQLSGTNYLSLAEVQVFSE
jgi:hypothetical protein